MKHMLTRTLSVAMLGSAIGAISAPAVAYNLISEDGTELNLDLEIVAGYFNSDSAYLHSSPESPSWTEAYAKYGLSGSQAIGNGALFGAVNLVSSGTFGDGDAAGFTTGDERDTAIEDLYVGYRTDMFEVSAGSQKITIGDGFIVNDDGLNLGDGTGPLSRDGGGYYLAAKRAFDKTAVIRVGSDEGARGDLFWFESDNPGQLKMEAAGINLEYVTDHGTFGAMYLEGLGTDEALDPGNASGRDGMETLSVRYQGNAGVENLFLSAEYSTQENGLSGADSSAWYAEAAWTFSNVKWSPSIGYRYSTFDEGYDPLFYGFNRGYGTWFQGEVAGNYAGPFNNSADIQQISLKASPTETLSIGALFFDYSNATTFGAFNSDAQELDLYAEWVVNDNLIISPLVGIYSPNSNNTVQNDKSDNTYFQILAIVPF